MGDAAAAESMVASAHFLARKSMRTVVSASIQLDSIALCNLKHCNQCISVAYICLCGAPKVLSIIELLNRRPITARNTPY